MRNKRLETSKKVDIVSFISMLIGGFVVLFYCIIPNPSYLVAGIVAIVGILGLILAFWGRNRIGKNDLYGKGIALTGFIINLVMISGSIMWLTLDLLGMPRQFGISGETDQKMYIVVGVSFVCAAFAIVISVIYNRFSKKYK